MSENLEVLESSMLRAVVDPGQGADLVSLEYRPAGIELLWSRQAPDPGQDDSASADSVETFYARYRGGMQEVLPNGGSPYETDGLELGFHGEAWKAQWAIEDTQDRDAICCITSLSQLPLQLRKSFRLLKGGAKLEVRSTVENRSEQRVDVMWGFHPVFAEALVGDGAVLHLRVREIQVHPEPFGTRQILSTGASGPPRQLFGSVPGWVDGQVPLFDGDGGTADLFYGVMADGRYEIVNARTNVSLAVEWDRQIFPHVWIWQECHSDDGYPWFGRHHIVGVEPFSSYPGTGLASAIANGTSMTLAPRQKVTAWLTMEPRAVRQIGGPR